MASKTVYCGIILMMAGSAAATTPQQAAQRWAQFSGGLPAKVAYGQSGKIWVLDLKAGSTASIASWDAGAPGHSLGSVRWSPSGKRLMLHNADSVNVINADGSGMKRIFRGHQCSDLIWGDWNGDSAIVYSTGDAKKVVQTRLLPDNGPGTTLVLVDEPPHGSCYSSVGTDGEFLTYNDIQGNAATGGFHRPLIKNLRTGFVKTLIPDNADMCQLTLIPDSRFKAMGEEESHSVPGSIFDTLGNPAGKLPKIGSYDQRGFAWSNQLEYFLSQGEETAPTNNWTWIRSWSRRAQSANILLSDTGSMDMRYPDLWITPSDVSGSVGKAPPSLPERQLSRSELCSLASHAEAEIYATTGIRLGRSSIGMISSGLYIIRQKGRAPSLVLLRED